MEYDKEIKAYLEFKQAERNELDRLKAVTDAHTAERIAEIRNKLIKEQEAFEVAKAKERLEKLAGKDEEKKIALANEVKNIEKDYREHEKEQSKKIHEIVKDLPKDEQKKIYAVIEQTEESPDNKFMISLWIGNRVNNIHGHENGITCASLSMTNPTNNTIVKNSLFPRFFACSSSSGVAFISFIKVSIFSYCCRSISIIQIKQ